MVAQNIYRYLWVIRHNESKSSKKHNQNRVSSFNNFVGPNPTQKLGELLKEV